MNQLLKITFVELKLRLRERVAMAFVVGLPVALLLAFGLQSGGAGPDKDLGGQTVAQYIAALGVGIALAVLGLQVVPSILATYREKGVLRRMGATPVHPALLLVAQVAVNLAAALVVVGLMIGIGSVAFGTPVPQRMPLFLLALGLGITSLFSVGLVIAALAPTARTAYGIGLLAFFPSLFLAGVYVPREQMPALLRHIGDFTPLGAGLKAMRDAWMGHAVQPLHLVIMVAFTVVAGALAARFFRWE